MRRLLLCLLVLALLLPGCGGRQETRVTVTPITTPAPEPTATPEPAETPAPTPEPTETPAPKSIAPEPTPAVVLLPLDAPDTEIPDADARAVSTPEPEPQTETYVLNTNTKKIHRPTCASVGDILPKNRQDVTGTLEEFIAQGYDPCKRCKPR